MFSYYSKDVPLALMILLLSTFSGCKGESTGLEAGKKYLLSDADGNTLATCKECGPSVKYDHSILCCYSNDSDDVPLALLIPSINDKDVAVKKAPKESGCKGLEGRRKYLISDTGKMLARCHDCEPSFGSFEPLAVHGSRHDIVAQFTFEPVGDKCAIRSDFDYYVAECNDCLMGGNYSISVFNYKQTLCAEATWIVEKYGDFYAFKGNSGKYMARCGGCVPGATKDFAFVFATTPIDSALWSAISV